MTATNATSLALLFVLLPMTCWGQIYGASGGAGDVTGMSRFPGGCLWETYCCERESICERYYRSLSILHKFGNFHGPAYSNSCPHGTCSMSAHQCNCSSPVAPVGATSAPFAAPATKAVRSPSRPVKAEIEEPELAPRVPVDPPVVEPPMAEEVPIEIDEPPVPSNGPSLELPKNPLPTLPVLPTNELPTTERRRNFPAQTVGVKLRVGKPTRAVSPARTVAAPQPRKISSGMRTQARSLRRWRSQSILDNN